MNKAVKILAQIIESDEDFEGRMDAYVKADGEVPKNFIELLDKARTIYEEVKNGKMPDSISELPPFFQEAFVELLTEKGLAKELVELSQKNLNKSVVRAIRRAIHSLEQKGIKIPKSEPEKTIQKRTLQQPQRPNSIVTLPLADGSQELFLINKFRHEFIILSTLIYYREGIRNFEILTSSKAGVKELKEKLITFGRAPVEVPYEIAHSLLERALKWHDEKNTVPPQGFLSEFRRWEKPKTEQKSNSESTQQKEIENWQDLIAQSAELLNKDPFSHWTLSWEEERRFELKINEIYTSQLIVNESKKFELIREQIDKTTDEFFGTKREFFASILKDASMLLQIDNKLELARLTSAIACALEKSDLPPSRIPFFRGIISRRLLIKTPSGTKSFEEIEKEILTQINAKNSQKGSGGLLITG